MRIHIIISTTRWLGFLPRLQFAKSGTLTPLVYYTQGFISISVVDMPAFLKGLL